MRMKHWSIVAVVVVLLVTLCAAALADDDVTIVSGKTAQAGTSLSKQSATAKPQLDIYTISPGTTIKFWIYRNGLAQVSPTYTLSQGNDLPIDYNNSGNKVKGALYHSVWKKTTQSSSTATYIHFAFVP